MRITLTFKAFFIILFISDKKTLKLLLINVLFNMYILL